MTPLEGFLSQAVLEADDKNEGDKQPDAVQLMTVHASKGLEFHHVYLIGLEQGLFPHVGRSGNEDEDEKAVSEERRLMQRGHDARAPQAAHQLLRPSPHVRRVPRQSSLAVFG